MLILTIIIVALVTIIWVLMAEKKGDPVEMEHYYQQIQRPGNDISQNLTETKMESDEEQVCHIKPSRHTLDR